MTELPSLFFGGADQIAALGAALTAFVLLSLIGGAVGGRDRLPGSEPLIGWAVMSIVFTVVPVWTGLPFTPLFHVLVAAAALAAWRLYRSETQLLPLGAHRVLVLALPLLLLGAAMQASQWDEFSHWLASIQYLIDNDAFPARDRPPSTASFPAYPYGWPLLGYLAAKLGGGYREGMAPAANVLLLASYGLVVAYLIRRAVSGGMVRPPSWPMAAWGFLFATVLSTVFIEKLVLTAYSDPSTGVAMGLTGILGWLMVEAVAQGDVKAARRYAFSASLMGAALLNIKQPHLVLFVIAAAAALFVVLRLRAVSFAEWLRLAAILIAVPALVYLSWRHHVAAELTGREFHVMAFADWNIALLPDILARAAKVWASKGFFFGMMLVLTGIGLFALIRPDTPFKRFSLIVGIVFVGYNAFLILTYVIAFGASDAKNVASYWRYNTQIGLLGAAAMAVGLATWYRAKWADHRWTTGKLVWLPVVIALLSPVVFAKTLRFDRDVQKTYARAIAKELPTLLTKDDGLFVVDPRGSGLIGVVAKHELQLSARFVGFLSAFFPQDRATLSAAVEQPGVTHVWVHTQSEATQAYFALPDQSTATHLFKRDGEKWTLVKSWPLPEGYDMTKIP